MREQLVHSNISFANTISSIQNTVNKSLNQLLDRISLDIGFDEPCSRYVKVSLLPPITLILQQVEASITSVTNIQKMFQGMPILEDASPLYLMKKFVPYIDWDNYQAEAQSFKMERKVSSDANPPPPGGNNSPMGNNNSPF